MPTITEELLYPPNVYQLATTDPVKGGAPVFDIDDSTIVTDGHSNAATKQLADRTAFLKAVLDQFGEARSIGGDEFTDYEAKYVAGTDFDDLRETGLYMAGGSVSDNPAGNEVGKLVVIARTTLAGGPEGALIDSQSVTQIFFAADAIYTRNTTGTGIPAATWSTWRIYEPSDVVTPAGAVQAFARNTAPTGWLKANGQAVSRTAYARLFAAIGTTFGTGDGSTTFNVPDLRGEFIRGWDDGRGVDTGRAFGSAQADELESHTHGILANGNDDISPVGGTTNYRPGGDTAMTGVTGSTGGTETRPRNIALLYCIRF